MEQMKSVDLKEVAKRFTERYYPQWLSRVDRIWEMLEKVDPNSFYSESAKPQYLQRGAFGIAGEMEPNFEGCISGIAVFAFTCQNIQNDDDISENEIKKQLSITQTNLNISAGLQAKLENVLSEMLPSMAGETIAKTKNKKLAKQETSDRGNKGFVVYLARSSGFGTTNFLVDEEELHSKYLSTKKEYDIVVYQRNVEVKSVIEMDGAEDIQFQPIELHSNILKLLILFLKYKDEPLPFLELYHCAWKDGASYKADVIDSDTIMDDLKTGVSSLRNHFKKVENFIIPNAERKAETYICKGSFKFCLVLKKSMTQLYTLEVD